MTERVRQAILKLQKAESVYAMISLCTKMPYIECDGETYDDQIFVYHKEEHAKREEKKLIEKKIPVKIIKLEKSAILPFFVNLFPLGVNCVVIDRGMEGALAVQLQELVNRPNTNALPNGKVIIENPELHLTAAYYMQELRRQPADLDKESLKELYEEMLNHFQKGRFLIVGREADNSLVLLKEKNEDLFQPIFTDTYEYQKFCTLHKEEKFKVGVAEANNLLKVLAPNARGIVLNPVGINVQLQLNKK